MNKIICDICGTSYLETEESCPVCGCSRASAADFLNADVLEEDLSAEETVAVNSVKKEIFDFDKVNAVPVADDDDEDYEDDDEDEDDEDDDDDSPRSNTFVVILLTILIIALLGAAAFIFFRFFLPGKAEETVPTTIAQEIPETTEATEATIPCDYMTMTNAGIAELSAEGQQFLLHIRAIPENTTDKIVYTSGDESIATVTEDGKITAVAEGETIVYISCGKYSIECPVIVKYEEETIPTTEAVEETVGEVTVPETTEATVPAANPNVTLKLKKTDIQLGVYYQFQLQLDCELKPEDVTWTSEHPHIAKVDEQGNVTAVKDGTTSITAKYGDQEVKCMVRCVWY